jgi:hypothetical protein
MVMSLRNLSCMNNCKLWQIFVLLKLFFFSVYLILLSTTRGATHTKPTADMIMTQFEEEWVAQGLWESPTS